jgi:thiol-disulfide isomerase/thioredoxin
MEMAERKTLARRAGRGALVGLVVGLLLAGAAVWAGYAPDGLTAPALLALAAAAGAAVCAAGEVVAASPVGACLGLAAGALLGASLADSVGTAAAGRLVGQRAEIHGPTLSGKTFDIAEYRGKVVLVDFWATWCPPCRAELPRIRALKERYADQGFRVVGVSLDDSREDLAGYVSRHHLDWPQVFYGGQANPLVQKYQVHGIPFTLLVNRDGTIAAARLFGDQVDEAVARLVTADPGASPADAPPPGGRDLLTPFFAVAGCLAGMLIERGLRNPA